MYKIVRFSKETEALSYILWRFKKSVAYTKALVWQLDISLLFDKCIQFFFVNNRNNFLWYFVKLYLKIFQYFYFVLSVLEVLYSKKVF